MILRHHNALKEWHMNYEQKFRKSDRLIDRALAAAAKSPYTPAIIAVIVLVAVVVALWIF